MSAVTKTRRLFFLATGVSAVMGIIASCTFPEPRLVEDTEGGTEGGGGDVNVGETSDEDGGVVADATSEGVDFDAAPSFDATSEKPFVDEAGCVCDCDKDGYRTKEQDAAGCDASTTAFDCDDLDPRANPDAGFVADLPTQDTKGDWNCDGTFTLEWPMGVKDCASYNSGVLGSGGCGSIAGFQETEVGCGVESTSWLQCATPVIVGACKTGSQEKRVQRCK